MTQRAAGILLHPTSLPGPHGMGDLGPSAYRFVDWLASAGMSYWQVLPLVPAGAGDSPYSSWSAFAANPWLVSLDELVTVGLLDQADLDGAPDSDPERVDFNAVKAFKGPRLNKAADRLLSQRHPLSDAFAEFKAQADWAEQAMLFAALFEEQGQKPWWQWPEALRTRQRLALREARARLALDVDRGVAIQFLFDQQWKRLRGHCQTRGVRILGDLPIYVDANSVDVWVDQRLFQLDEAGNRLEVAGVPPDAFSETGQLWGNPLYRWDRMAEEGYGWWIARVKRALELHDRVRIDHFRAFSAYWAVPATAEDARAGRWVPGPGRALFDALNAALGDLPILAEDLGVIDADVIALLAATGLPGMHVLQFAFGDTAKNPYLPHNHRLHSVVYTGTHDNDTTLGWWLKAPAQVQDHVRHYFGVSGYDLVWDMIRAALASVGETAVIPMQDTLALDSQGRMNTPSLASGNWAWRLRPDGLREDVAARLRHLNQIYARC